MCNAAAGLAHVALQHHRRVGYRLRGPLLPPRDPVPARLPALGAARQGAHANSPPERRRRPVREKHSTFTLADSELVIFWVGGEGCRVSFIKKTSNAKNSSYQPERHRCTLALEGCGWCCKDKTVHRHTVEQRVTRERGGAGGGRWERMGGDIAEEREGEKRGNAVQAFLSKSRARRDTFPTLDEYRAAQLGW